MTYAGAQVNAMRSGKQMDAESLALMRIVDKYNIDPKDIKSLLDWRHSHDFEDGTQRAAAR